MALMDPILLSFPIMEIGGGLTDITAATRIAGIALKTSFQIATKQWISPHPPS